MKRTSSEAGMRYISGSRSAKKRIRRAPPTVASVVKREVNRTKETKYTDRAVWNAAATNAGSVLSLINSLARGDDAFNNFDGNTVYPTGIMFKWGAVTNQEYNHVRFLVFQWLENTIPGISDLLQDTSTGTATYSAVHVNNRGRMNVLYDKRVIIAPTACTSTGVVIGAGHATGQYYISGSKLRPIKYRIGSSDIISGNVFCLVISDDGAVTYPGYNFYSRLSFTD